MFGNTKIFTLINKDVDSLEKSLAFLGKSFSQMQKDFKDASGLNKFKAAFSGIGKSVEDLTSALDEKEIAKIIDQFNGLNTEVERLDFINKQTDVGLKSFFTTVKTGKTSMVEYTTSAQAATAAQNTMSLSSKALGIGLNVLRIALNMFATMLIISAISNFVQWLSNLKSEAEKAAEAIEKQTEKIRELNSEISSLDSELNNLKGVENRTKAEENYLSVLEKELEVKKELAKQEQQKLYEQKYGQREDLNVTNGSWLTDLLGYTDPNATPTITVDPIANIEKTIKLYQDALDELSTAETTEDIDRLNQGILRTEKYLTETYKELYNFKEAIGELPPEADALLDSLLKVIDKQAAFEQNLQNNESIKKYVDEIKELTELDVRSISFDDAGMSKGEMAFKVLSSSAKSYGLTVEELIDHLLQFGYVQRDVAEIINLPSFDEASKAIDEIQSAYSALSNAIDEYNATGLISVDTFQEVISLGEEYIKYLIDENGQLILNKDSLQSLIAAKIDDMAVSQAIAMIDNVSKMDSEREALDTLTASTEHAAMATWDFVYAKIADLDSSDAVKDALTERAKQMQELADATKLAIGTKGIGYSSKTASQESEAFKKAYNYIQYLRDLGVISEREYLDRLYDLNEKYNKGNVELWRKYNLEIYNGQNKLYDDEIARLNKQIAASDEYYDKKISRLKEELALLDKEWNQEDALLKIEKARQELEKAKSQKTAQIYREGEGFVWEADIEAVQSAQSNLDDLLKDWEREQQKLNLQQQIDNLENAKKRNREAIESQIADIEEMRDKWQESVTTIGVSLDEYDQRLYSTAESEKVVLDTMLARQEEYTSKVVELARRRAAAIAEAAAAEASAAAAKASIGSAQSARGYAQGGVVDYTGDAILHGSPTNPELVLNSAGIQNVGAALGIGSNSTNLIANFLNNANSGSISSLVGANTYNINKIGSKLAARNIQVAQKFVPAGNNSNVTPIKFTVENMELHEVNDADKLRKEIESEFNNSMLQVLFKR